MNQMPLTSRTDRESMVAQILEARIRSMHEMEAEIRQLKAHLAEIKLRNTLLRGRS